MINFIIIALITTWVWLEELRIILIISVAFQYFKLFDVFNMLYDGGCLFG